MRLELPTVHSDDHIRLVFKDEVAFTEGCGSFVDAFDTANREHHVKRAPVGKILHAYNEHNDEVYAIEGGAAQAEGLDMRDIYGHIQQLPDIAATNMATGEYRGVRGYGFVGGVGLRYLYTAKKKYGQQFVGQWATRPGRAKQARDLLHTVQHCGNKTVARVQKWGFPYEDELKLQRKLMDKICQYNGTASFTFPSAMIGVNGGYGVHKDKRDVQRTLWLVTGTGALVFPKYEHIVWLHPGDIIAFSGDKEWHANMVSPQAEQQRQATERRCNAVWEGPLAPVIPQLDGDMDEEQRDEQWQLLREERRREAAEARAELRAQGIQAHQAQQIVCFFFQKQQQSYFLNHHNRNNPSQQVVSGDYVFDSNHGNEQEEEQEEQQEEEQSPCDYEQQRARNIERNQQELRRLGLL